MARLLGSIEPCVLGAAVTSLARSMLPGPSMHLATPMIMTASCLVPKRGTSIRVRRSSSTMREACIRDEVSRWRPSPTQTSVVCCASKMRPLHSCRWSSSLADVARLIDSSSTRGSSCGGPSGGSRLEDGCEKSGTGDEIVLADKDEVGVDEYGRRAHESVSDRDGVGRKTAALGRREAVQGDWWPAEPCIANLSAPSPSAVEDTCE